MAQLTVRQKAAISNREALKWISLQKFVCLRYWDDRPKGVNLKSLLLDWLYAKEQGMDFSEVCPYASDHFEVLTDIEAYEELGECRHQLVYFHGERMQELVYFDGERMQKLV